MLYLANKYGTQAHLRLLARYLLITRITRQYLSGLIGLLYHYLDNNIVSFIISKNLHKYITIFSKHKIKRYFYFISNPKTCAVLLAISSSTKNKKLLSNSNQPKVLHSSFLLYLFKPSAVSNIVEPLQ